MVRYETLERKMSFKQANTIEEVDKILQEQKKKGTISKSSKLRAEIRKLELKIRKRKRDEVESRSNRKKIAYDKNAGK